MTARILLLCLGVLFRFVAQGAPGDLDLSFRSDVQRRFGVMDLQNDGKVIVATFYGDGSTARSDLYARNTNALVRLNVDGSVDASFSPVSISQVLASVGENIAADFYALAIQPDGKILVGGGFDTLNTKPRSHLARLEPDGSVDSNFNPIISLREVRSIIVQPDGKILVGGLADAFGSGIARLNPDGSADDGFAAHTEGGEVNSIVLLQDGTVLLGGYFQHINGIQRDSNARINSDGTLHSAFANIELGGAEASVGELALDARGRVVLAGRFSSIAGVARRGLARLDLSGQLDGTFDPGSGINPDSFGGNRIFSVAVQDDGKIIVGGRFQRFNGIQRTNIVRLNEDGSVDLAFQADSNSTSLNLVAHVLLQPDDRVLLGHSGGVARLYGGDALPQLILTRTGGTVLTWPIREGSGFVLEFTDGLGPAADWRPETSEPVFVGEQHLVPIDTSIGSRFFRLRQE